MCSSAATHNRSVKGTSNSAAVAWFPSCLLFLYVGVVLAGIMAPWSGTLAASEPKITLRVVVPEEFKHSKLAPNGDPEPVRYTKAYEAFWWNCVMVKAKDLHARCPFICSGTPGASYGCLNGSHDADEQIAGLLKRFSPSTVQAYLKQFASTPDAQRGLSGYGYFRNGPEAEDVSN